MELKHSRYKLYINKEDILIAIKKLPSEHASEMKPLQKLLKILQIVIAKNIKIFSVNCYKNKFPDLMKKDAEIIKNLITPQNTIPTQSITYPVLQRSSKVSFSYN